MSTQQLRVQVVFAYAERQHLVDVVVPAGATIADAIRASGILERHPEIELATMRVGIFAQLRAPDDVLREGDRVEIYRPLKIDPKQARRERAQQRRR